jgi:hypothetical protein
MYEKELMMAILTASTALAGLTGVVIGQIVQSGLATKIKFWLKVPLIFSFLLALLAVMYAISWLISPSDLDRLVSLHCFAGQLSLFSGVSATFWLRG